MQRRNFLQQAAVTAALTSGGILASKGINHRAIQKEDNLSPFLYQKSLENARQMPGFLFNFIATKEQTGGQFAILEGMGIKGAEPFMHMHEYEDEAFYMVEGEMIAVVGEKEYHLRPGDFAFLPRRIPHTQRFITEKIHVLLFVSPGGLEEYFWELSMPAKNLEIPGIPTEPPSPEFMAKVMEMNKKFGIIPA